MTQADHESRVRLGLHKGCSRQGWSEVSHPLFDPEMEACSSWAR